jgi:hypothetical protein
MTSAPSPALPKHGLMRGKLPPRLTLAKSITRNILKKKKKVLVPNHES